MRLLARTFDVTALCFYRRATRPTDAQVRAGIAGLGELAEVEAFPIPQENSRARLFVDHARSVLTGNAYTRFAYSSRDFASRLKELIGEKQFDLVHMDSLDLSAYLPLLNGLPVVCTHHNVESSLLRRRSRAEGGLKGLYVGHQAELTEKEERAFVPEFALNVTVSENDRAELAKLAPSARIAVVPNGVDTQVFTPENREQDGLVFVGGHSWLPNREAMSHFAAEILPLVNKQCGHVPVTWVGRAPESVIREYTTKFGFHMTGFVDDIRPFVRSAACYVVPLLTGGGTRLKILDAWSMGKAVVSTSVGCEGLAAVDGENILIRDEPAAFADAVRAVLSDETLRQRLGANARKIAEQTYDWDIIGKTMTADYLKVARVRVPRAGTARLGQA
jgi:glycosyltransferase involved in cell wall biosynthesis